MNLPHLRWYIAVLLCIVTTINYVDRQALSVTAPLLMELFKLSNVQYGFITTGFLFAYALGQLLCGPVIDRYGTQRSFSVAVSAWSVAGMLHAATTGFTSLLGYRILLGLAEAANFPLALKAIAEWFPARDRSMAVGILMIGPGLGAIIAPPLLAFITTFAGWQWAFIVPGTIGLLWLWVWWLFYEAPELHKLLDPVERRLILAGRVREDARTAIPGWRLILKRREVKGLLLSRFVADGAFYFFVFWLPAYLASERDLDILQIGAVAWVPFLAADLGSLCGGWTGARLIRAGWSLDRARKFVIWAGALSVPLCMPALWFESVAVTIGVISLALFAIQFKQSSLFALPADLYPAREVGTVWGIFGAAGSFGAMLFSPLVGWLIDNWSYAPVFGLVSLMHILSAICVGIFVPRIESSAPEDGEP